MKLSLTSMLLASATTVLTNANATSKVNPNLVAGTWRMASSSIISNGTSSTLWGTDGYGLLVFTSSLHFAVQFNLANLSRLPSDNDRTTGTPEQNAALIAGTLALSGTYTVDEKGEFTGEKVLGSTFPNWIGLQRGTDQLTETVCEGGKQTIEELIVVQESITRIVWKKMD